ncbi:MAG: hypothetical protein HC904_13910 [Blastochloris sp.]|nr:hypothetical protein [Blastochloris sp.]
MKLVWGRSGIGWVIFLSITWVVLWEDGFRLGAEEQQSQGYRFEKVVIRLLTGSEDLGTGYTSEWDIPAKFNHHSGRNISVKCIRWGNSVYLGDAMRQWQLGRGEESFEMVVGFYDIEEREGEGEAQAVLKSGAPGGNHAGIWRRSWGEITEAELAALIAGIKDKPLAEAQAYARAEAKRLRAKPGIIDINPKVNKDQRRIQCSIPFEVFYREILKAEPEPQTELKLWGQNVPPSLIAGSRSRQK